MSLGMSYEERVKTQRAFAAEMRQNEGESQLTRLHQEVARKRKACEELDSEMSRIEYHNAIQRLQTRSQTLKGAQSKAMHSAASNALRKSLSEAEHRLANHPFKYQGVRLPNTFDYSDHAALYRERKPYDPWILERSGL